MDVVFAKVLNNPKLKRVLQMVLSLGGYLQAGQVPTNPATTSRLRSATMIQTQNSSATPGLDVNSVTAITGGTLSGPVSKNQLNNYLSSFVSNNYPDLKAFTDDIIEFEKAFRCTFWTISVFFFGVSIFGNFLSCRILLLLGQLIWKSWTWKF